MAKLKTFSFPDDDLDLYDWLSEQNHQSELVRRGISLVRVEKERGVDLLTVLEGKETIQERDLAFRVEQSIRQAFKSLRLNGHSIPQEQEDAAAASALLGARRDI